MPVFMWVSTSAYLLNDEGPLPHRRDPRDELARVPPVRPDQLQSRKAGDECPQHRFGPIAVLDAS